VDIEVCDTVDLNDTASWTKSAATTMNAEVAMDCLAGANIAIPSNGLSGFRWSSEAKLTVNGTEEDRSANSDYTKGFGGGTNSCYGHVGNPLGVVTLAQNDDLGISVQEYVNSQGGGGNFETEPFGDNEGITFWGINLDTMDNEGTGDAPVLIHNMKQQV
jgi:hypothetical protein